MATPFRVVFDTNTFTPDNFYLLEQSPMLKLCKSGRIVPIYGHVFLEETFRSYGAEKKRKELVERWLPFITKTVNRFCDDFIGIWHKELIQGRGLKTNIYMARQRPGRLTLTRAQHSIGRLLACMASLKTCSGYRRREANCAARNIEGHSQ